MVDSNLQRETILPSERAFAYKMKMDAVRRTAGRPSKNNPRRLVGNLESADMVGEASVDSGRQVQRYIRLTELIPELLTMVDEKKISFNPAIELSFLKPEEQIDFLEAMDMEQNVPSLSQVQRIKKLSQDRNCTIDTMQEIMAEVKKSELDKVTLKNDVLKKYFPKSYTPKQMQDTIIKLLEAWQKNDNIRLLGKAKVMSDGQRILT